MPYNNFYPMGYQQQFQQPIYQQPSRPQQPVQQQIQSGGLVPTPNEAYARNYPVAPGNSITFKDENAPYVYTKTMGFSQLETPRFERFRLVREDEIVDQAHMAQPLPEQHPDYALASDYDELRKLVEYLDKKVSGLEDNFKKPTKKLSKTATEKDEVSG